MNKKPYDGTKGTAFEEVSGVIRRALHGLNKDEVDFVMNGNRVLDPNEVVASRPIAEEKAPTQYAIDMMAKQEAERAQNESLAGKVSNMASRFANMFTAKDSSSPSQRQ